MPSSGGCWWSLRENITNFYGRKEPTWQGTTSTQQLHTKTSTSNFRKLLLKSKKAPERGNSSYLVQRSRFSGWARCPEGSWWSSLRSLSGWLSFLLPSASEESQVKNKPIPKFLQHTTFVSKTKLQVTPAGGHDWTVWPGRWPWRCCTDSLQTWAAGWAPGPAEGFPARGKTSWWPGQKSPGAAGWC